MCFKTGKGLEWC